MSCKSDCDDAWNREVVFCQRIRDINAVYSCVTQMRYRRDACYDRCDAANPTHSGQQACYDRCSANWNAQQSRCAGLPNGTQRTACIRAADSNYDACINQCYRGF